MELKNLTRDLFCKVKEYDKDKIGEVFEVTQDDLDSIYYLDYLDFWFRGEESSRKRYVSYHHFIKQCKDWCFKNHVSLTTELYQ